MIYVIGVDHNREQFPHDMNMQERVENFKNLVRKLCNENNIRVLAEEWCDDARSSSITGTTYSEVIAAELKIDYLPCDPNRVERAGLKIKGRDQIAQELGMSIQTIQENSEEERRINETEAAKEGDKRRERYWLARIIDHCGTEGNIVLICGFGHADDFVGLAESRGYEAMRVLIPSS